jgi:hypothetical protein
MSEHNAKAHLAKAHEHLKHMDEYHANMKEHVLNAARTNHTYEPSEHLMQGYAHHAKLAHESLKAHEKAR